MYHSLRIFCNAFFCTLSKLSQSSWVRVLCYITQDCSNSDSNSDSDSDSEVDIGIDAFTASNFHVFLLVNS